MSEKDEKAGSARGAALPPARTLAQRNWETIEEASRQLEEERAARFAAADLSSIDARLELAEAHPMLEDLYFVDTSSGSSFYEVVFDHVFARRSGLYVDGAYRVGKTTAIKNAIERLGRDLPKLAVFFHSVKRDAKQSRDQFFKSMLKSFHYPASKHQDPADVLTRHMMGRAARAGSRTCVLFIDEAQMLTIMELRYLLELWNELRLQKFLLVTILVGQSSEPGQAGVDSLVQLRDQKDHGPVVARFLVKPYTLGGIHNKSELNEFLAAYDKLCYPVESVWPYSRFFRKPAYDRGWRLKQEADQLWPALLEHTGIKPKARILKKSGFRTGFVVRAIHGFLLDGMNADVKPRIGGNSGDDSWVTALEDAGDPDLFI